MSLETTHYSSINCVLYHSDYQSGDDGRDINRSQETRHFSSFNCGEIVDDFGIGGYRSHTIHSSSHKLGGCGRFLGFLFSSFPVDKNIHGDERVRYSGHVNERGDISVDDGRRGTRSQ